MGLQQANISIFELSDTTDITSNDTHASESDSPYEDSEAKVTNPALKYKAHEGTQFLYIHELRLMSS